MISAEKYCICLYEAENNLRSTQDCFVACDGQHELMRLRQQEEENEKDSNSR